MSTVEPAENELNLDGFVNLAKGFGVTERPYYVRDSKASLSSMLALYEQDWLAQAIVCRVTEMALREGFDFEKPDGTLDETTKDRFKELDFDPFNPVGVFRNAIDLGRAAGGSLIVMLPERGNIDNLTLPAKPGEGLRRIFTVKWSEIAIEERNSDRNSPNYYRPEIYRISKTEWAGMRLHHSRVIPCEGAPKAEPTPEQPWVSVLEAAYATLADYGMAWEGASRLLQESSILIIKMAGLFAALGRNGGEIQKARLKAMNEGKSLMKTLFLDASGNEDATRIAASFADLPELLTENTKRVSGMARTPMTVLMGISPAGMNATGESDMRQYYDYLQSFRTGSLEPKLARIGEAIAGERRKIRWPNLWRPTAVEQEDIREKKIESNKALWEMEVASSLQILISMAEDKSLGLEVPEEQLEKLKALLAKGETDVPGLKKEPVASPFEDPNARDTEDPTDATDPSDESDPEQKDPNVTGKRVPGVSNKTDVDSLPRSGRSGDRKRN